MVVSPELNVGLGVYGGGSSSGIPSRSRSGGILLVSSGGGEETVTEGGGFPEGAEGVNVDIIYTLHRDFLRL